MSELTALERARNHRLGRGARTITEEDVVLAIEWAAGRLTVGQVMAGMEYKKATATVYVRLAMALRFAVQHNRLTIQGLDTTPEARDE